MSPPKKRKSDTLLEESVSIDSISKIDSKDFVVRESEKRKTRHQKAINTISFTIVGGFFAILILYFLSGLIGFCDIQNQTPINIIDKIGTVLISLIIGFYFSSYLRS